MFASHTTEKRTSIYIKFSQKANSSTIKWAKIINRYFMEEAVQNDQQAHEKKFNIINNRKKNKNPNKVPVHIYKNGYTHLKYRKLIIQKTKYKDAESGRSPGEGIGYLLQHSWASLVTQLVNNLPAMQETWVWSQGWECRLEKGKATHSNILGWRIPWTPWGCRVRQDSVTFTSQH